MKTETEEFLKLSRDVVVAMIEGRLRQGKVEPFVGHERRRLPRWPFPGQVELRPADDDHCPPSFFDCRDLSESGMGMCGDQAFEIGTIVELALHRPEATLYGRAVVRYCMKTHRGHMIGVEFLFDD